MGAEYIKLYGTSGECDSAFYLGEGAVYFYASTEDRYMIKGASLILGSTELIMKHLLNTDTRRLETAVTEKGSDIKRISVEKFLEGLKNLSFLMNVSVVLAKQVLLTNRIIQKNMEKLTGEEKKMRDRCIEYYRIVARLKTEYDKRRLPWIKALAQEFESSLTYTKGEAFFRSAEPVKLAESVAISEKDIEYPRGAVICEENTIGDEMFILKSGAIDVSIAGNSVATISDPGTVIGEMALLLGEKRTATLTAKNGVVISRISKKDLKELAAKGGDVLTGLALSLAKRHYYNIVKIDSINRSLAEREIDGDEGAAPAPVVNKVTSDLQKLKMKADETIRKQKAEYLYDLVD